MIDLLALLVLISPLVFVAFLGITVITVILRAIIRAWFRLGKCEPVRMIENTEN